MSASQHDLWRTCCVAEGHVAHVQHDTFGSGTQDVDWLPAVGVRGWILITKDKQIRKARD